MAMSRADIIANAACNQIHTCKRCHSEFKPKRAGRNQYCSRKCYFEFKAARKALTDAKCVSFKVNRAKCRHCGAWFSGRANQALCSDECRRAHNRIYARAYDEAKYHPRQFECKECGCEVVAKYGTKRRLFCSEACSDKHFKRIMRKKEKARLRGVKVEEVDPIKVFNRDGWRCQICGKKTPKEKRGSVDKLAPELDHIVPLSVGGDHSYMNTQCTCRQCNGRKSNKVYGQLPLFAT